MLLRTLLSALLAGARLAAAGELQEDLKARRARALEALGPDSMLILWSAAMRTYSHDVEYEYRQDSTLYYLTGIDQEETILVLMPGNETRKEVLFVKPRDTVRALGWKDLEQGGRGRGERDCSCLHDGGVRTFCQLALRPSRL